LVKVITDTNSLPKAAGGVTRFISGNAIGRNGKKTKRDDRLFLEIHPCQYSSLRIWSLSMEITLKVTASPLPHQLSAIGDGLAAFNTSDVGPAEKLPLAVLVSDGDGTILGGISGFTGWGWLYVQWLWLDDSLRGQGLAGRMLQAAEDEAIARGCHGAYIDTFNPTALKVYQRQGYESFGVLNDFPPGRTRTFLQKALRKL
jgi:GNAT superfamily N-acetyltransferase